MFHLSIEYAVRKTYYNFRSISQIVFNIVQLANQFIFKRFLSKQRFSNLLAWLLADKFPKNRLTRSTAWIVVLHTMPNEQVFDKPKPQKYWLKFNFFKNAIILNLQPWIIVRTLLLVKTIFRFYPWRGTESL